jgi:hypothetical protein
MEAHMAALSIDAAAFNAATTDEKGTLAHRAFLKTAKIAHPDRGGSNAAFGAASAAFGALVAHIEDERCADALVSVGLGSAASDAAEAATLAIAGPSGTPPPHVMGKRLREDDEEGDADDAKRSKISVRVAVQAGGAVSVRVQA